MLAIRSSIDVCIHKKTPIVAENVPLSPASTHRRPAPSFARRRSPKKVSPIASTKTRALARPTPPTKDHCTDRRSVSASVLNRRAGRQKRPMTLLRPCSSGGGRSRVRAQTYLGI